MGENINYLIGDSEEAEKYKTNNGKINLLPLKNLPVVYYPIKGTDSYDIKNNIKRISSEDNNKKTLDLNNSLSKLENGPNIFLANEFFDALPIKQFIKKNNKWFEKYVEISSEKKKYYN